MRYKLPALFFCALVVTQLSVGVSLVLAHSGGSPYVLINGDFVEANPLSGVDANMAQDLAPANYLIGQPVEFAVDYNVFGAPGYQFRWLWGNKSDFLDGGKVSRTFDRPGTYIVTMQLKNGDESSFTDTDTIGVNIVPKPNYSLPAAKIQIQQTAKQKGSSTAKFKAIPTNDNSTTIISYKWSFADGSTGEGQTVEHDYKSLGSDFRIFPALRVTDGNGLYSDLLFELNSDSGVLKAADALSMPGVVGSNLQASANGSLTPIAITLLVVLLSVAAIITAVKIRKRKGHQN